MSIPNQNQSNNLGNSTEMSGDTKSIVVILLLVFAYPVGLILMWVWKMWPTWVRWLVSIPVILIILIFVLGIAAGILSSFNPGGARDRAIQERMRRDNIENSQKMMPETNQLERQ